VGWISRKIEKWAIKTQRRELESFVSNLRAIDGGEIGMVLAIATDKRHRLSEILGWNLLEPILVQISDITAAMTVNKLIREAQKAGDPVSASGLMVWLHTLRAANTLELRQLGRDMWGQLERGFPHCEDGQAGMLAVAGQYLNIDGYDQFPSGLSPKPF
jgi:hypothetical protein